MKLLLALSLLLGSTIAEAAPVNCSSGFASQISPHYQRINKDTFLIGWTIDINSGNLLNTSTSTSYCSQGQCGGSFNYQIQWCNTSACSNPLLFNSVYGTVSWDATYGSQDTTASELEWVNTFSIQPITLDLLAGLNYTFIKNVYITSATCQYEVGV